jgi:hypothetical protein
LVFDELVMLVTSGIAPEAWFLAFIRQKQTSHNIPHLRLEETDVNSFVW